jgi:hypothetical protein
VPAGAGLPQDGADGFGLVPAFEVPEVSQDSEGTETGANEEDSGEQESESGNEESSSEGVWGNNAQDFFEPIVTEAGTVITREGEYALVVGGETTQSHSCFFCVVRRYDVAGNESGSFLRTGDSILKYGFVPKKMEIRIPTGRFLSTVIPGDTSIPDAEGTSSFLSVCVLWGIRRLLLARFFIV